MATDDEPDGLDDRERARNRRRDRKQRPRMVVDNAGVKRVLQALAFRRRRDSAGPSQGSPSP
ncbi:MAG: hypothetical protein ABR950_05515 [Candidatus Dormibacteria bacterium]